MADCCTTGSLATSPLSAEVHGCGPNGQIRIFSGDNLKLTVTVKDATETLVDLTGATIHFHVRPDATTAAVITKSSAIATEINILAQTGATLGQFELFLLPADTVSIDTVQYIYGFTIVFSDGTVRTVAQGDFVVTKRVVDLTAPPVSSGTPAPQTEAERNFIHTVATTASSFTVTIPGAMINNTYTITQGWLGTPTVVGFLLYSNLQTNQFTVSVAGGGSLVAGTQIMFHVRDHA